MVTMWVIVCISAIYLSYILMRARRATQQITTVDAFIYGRGAGAAYQGLNTRLSAVTAIATNFQTASVLLVGLSFGFDYGLSLIWTGLTFSGGVLLIWWLFNRLSANDIQRVFPAKTLAYDRLFPTLKHRSRLVLNTTIYFALLVTAVFEIWLTVGFIHGLSSSVSEVGKDFYATLAFGILCVMFIGTLFYYVFTGGFRAVAIGDAIELKAIALMLVVIVIGPLFYFSTGSFQAKTLLVGTKGFSLSSSFGLALFIGIFCLNTFWQLLDPQQWQRAAATKDAETYIRSLPSAAGWIFVTWSVPILTGALLASFNSDQIAGPVNESVFLLWRTIDTKLHANGFITIFVYAAIVIGVMSAALASADAAIIAFVQRIAAFFPQTITLPELRARSLLIALMVMACALLLYIQNPAIQNAIFAVYSAQVIFVIPWLRFVTTGGLRAVNRWAIGYSTAYLAILFFALVINLVPSISAVTGNFNFVLPLLVLCLGGLMLINPKAIRALLRLP